MLKSFVTIASIVLLTNVTASALFDNQPNPQCTRIQNGVAEAMALALKVAGHDPKRFVEAVNRQLSERAINRKDIGECDAEGDFALRKIEECAENNDQKCITTQQDVDDADKVRKTFENLEALLVAYKRYAFVKYCNEVRQGYAMVYINDIELDRARNTIKAIEADALAKNKDLDTDAIWKRANAGIVGIPVFGENCQIALHELFRQYGVIHPEHSIPKKDF